MGKEDSGSSDLHTNPCIILDWHTLKAFVNNKHGNQDIPILRKLLKESSHCKARHNYDAVCIPEPIVENLKEIIPQELMFIEAVEGFVKVEPVAVNDVFNAVIKAEGLKSLDGYDVSIICFNDIMKDIFANSGVTIIEPEAALKLIEEKRKALDKERGFSEYG
jgi:hypothetical protein